MRIVICATLLFVCLAVLPSVQGQNKKKLAEYNENDRKDTKERYTKRDLDSGKKLKNKGRKDSEEEREEKRYVKPRNTAVEKNEKFKNVVKKLREEDKLVEDRKKPKKSNTSQEKPKGRKVNRKEVQEVSEEKSRKRRQVKVISEEDDTEETEETVEDDVSETCTKNGKKCVSDEDTSEDDTEEDNTEEDTTDEDNTDEDTTEEESEEVVPKKRVSYVKKFAHEKQKKDQDKEIGNILKIHKKSGRGYSKNDEEDESSEESGLPKRLHHAFEDEE